MRTGSMPARNEADLSQISFIAHATPHVVILPHCRPPTPSASSRRCRTMLAGAADSSISPLKRCLLPRAPPGLCKDACKASRGHALQIADWKRLMDRQESESYQSLKALYLRTDIGCSTFRPDPTPAALHRREGWSTSGLSC